MKNLLLSLLAGVVGMALVLFLYERYVASPRDGAAPRAPDAVETEEIAASARARDGMARIVGDLARGAGDRARIAQALTTAAMHKVAVAEWYVSQGQWPESGEQIGLAPASSYAGPDVRSIALAAEGVIEIVFDPRHGQSATLRLVPHARPDTGILEWRCEATGFSDPGSLPDTCR